jgi:hypothetical protein
VLEIGLRGRAFARHFMIVTHASDVARARASLARLLLPEMMPVAPSDSSGGIVAYGQPSLCSLSGVEAHWGP